MNLNPFFWQYSFPDSLTFDRHLSKEALHWDDDVNLQQDNKQLQL